jgi:hypothetical protein
MHEFSCEVDIRAGYDNLGERQLAVSCYSTCEALEVWVSALDEGQFLQQLCSTSYVC